MKQNNKPDTKQPLVSFGDYQFTPEYANEYKNEYNNEVDDSFEFTN